MVRKNTRKSYQTDIIHFFINTHKDSKRHVFFSLPQADCESLYLRIIVRTIKQIITDNEHES